MDLARCNAGFKMLPCHIMDVTMVDDVRYLFFDNCDPA